MKTLLKLVLSIPLSLTFAASASAFERDDIGSGREQTWSMEAIVERALRTSNRVAEARAVADGARARAEAQKTRTLPRVMLGGRYTRLSRIDNEPLVPLQAGGAALTIDVPRDHYSLFARVAYPVSELVLQILPEIRASEDLAAASRFDEAVVRSDVALTSVELYLSHARAREVLAVAALTVSQAQRNLDRAEALVAAESGTRLDVLRFVARLSEAQGEVANRAASVTASAKSLRTLLNLSGTGPLSVGESLSEMPKRLFTGGSQIYISKAARERPELAAARLQVSSLKHRLASLRGAQWPSLSVEAEADYANPNALFVPVQGRFRESWRASVALTWAPTAALRASRDANSKQAGVRAARARLLAVQDRIEVEVVDAHAKYGAARTAMSAAQQRLEAAVEAAASARRGYELGVTTANELLGSEVDESRARLGLIAMGVAARVWQQRLLRAIGSFR